MSKGNERPYWLPDTQGFLAIGILLIVALCFVMLIFFADNLKSEVFAAISIVLGVLTGSLNSVYNYFFPGSKDTSGNSEALKKLALEPAPPPVVVTAPAIVPTGTAATDQMAEASLSEAELTYYRTLGDEDKRKFVGMSAAERVASIGKA